MIKQMQIQQQSLQKSIQNMMRDMDHTIVLSFKTPNAIEGKVE